MELIDKDAIVAEIERMFNEVKESTCESDTGTFYAMKHLRSFLDTLEVKEVDLEKGIYEWLSHGNITDIRYDDYCDEDIIETAKHFFELGLKAQKGE